MESPADLYARLETSYLDSPCSQASERDDVKGALGRRILSNV